MTRPLAVHDVIEAEGIPMADKGAYYSCQCPFHEDRIPSFVVYKNSNRFFCYGCNESGDAIAFIQKLKGVSFNEAMEYLGLKKVNHKPKPKPSIYDIISKEQDEGIDIHEKYGREFINVLEMQYMGQQLNKNMELQEKVKAKNPLKTWLDRYYDDICTEYRCLNKVVESMYEELSKHYTRMQEIERDFEIITNGTDEEKNALKDEWEDLI